MQSLFVRDHALAVLAKIDAFEMPSKQTPRLVERTHGRSSKTGAPIRRTDTSNDLRGRFVSGWAKGEYTPNLNEKIK